MDENVEEWFRLGEALFYGTAWAVAAGTGLVRSLADDMYKSWRNSLIVGSLSGFLGASVIGLYIGWTSNGSIAIPWAYIGAASLVGAFAKQQLEIINYTATFIPAAIKSFFTKRFQIEKVEKSPD